MCDEDTVEENIAYLKAARLSRRQFNTLTTGAALAMMLPRAANALTVTEHNVEVVTPDGLADCYFVHPADGKHPGVIVWPDILGLRPAFRTMGKRLAESGYSVLVINPYYRTGKAPLVAVGATSQDEAVRTKIFPIARQLNARTTTSDARSFVSFLDQQSAVDQDRMIGTTGYCMGGSMTMLTAAAMPDRIGAGASFHGSRLVTDKEESPHLLVPGMKAHFLVAIAASDDERDPEAKNVLRKSFDEAGLPAEIEVYEGAMHGWCSIDSPVYHEMQAEKAWTRLLALFDTALT